MRLALAALICLTAMPAPAQTLLCLGTRPGFMFVVTDTDRVAFDYLGDGEFRLDPPLGPAVGSSSHDLVTMRERWPVVLEYRTCEVVSLEMPLTLEIGVPTSAGMRPLTGCCRWSTMD